MPSVLLCSVSFLSLHKVKRCEQIQNVSKQANDGAFIPDISVYPRSTFAVDFTEDFVNFQWLALMLDTEIICVREKKRWLFVICLGATTEVGVNHANYLWFSAHERPNGHTCVVLFRQHRMLVPMLQCAARRQKCQHTILHPPTSRIASFGVEYN